MQAPGAGLRVAPDLSDAPGALAYRRRVGSDEGAVASRGGVRRAKARGRAAGGAAGEGGPAGATMPSGPVRRADALRTTVRRAAIRQSPVRFCPAVCRLWAGRCASGRQLLPEPARRVREARAAGAEAREWGPARPGPRPE